MIDLDEIQDISETIDKLLSGSNAGPSISSYAAARQLMRALKEIAEAQAEIQKDLTWIKRKLSDEI